MIAERTDAVVVLAMHVGGERAAQCRVHRAGGRGNGEPARQKRIQHGREGGAGFGNQQPGFGIEGFEPVEPGAQDQGAVGVLRRVAIGARVAARQHGTRSFGFGEGEVEFGLTLGPGRARARGCGTAPPGERIGLPADAHA